jgi:acyl carrier protein
MKIGATTNMLNQTVLSFLTHAAADAHVTLPDTDASLFLSGVLDSFTLVDFVAVIENEYGIRVDDADLRPENFDTIQSVERFITRAQGEQ